MNFPSSTPGLSLPSSNVTSTVTAPLGIVKVYVLASTSTAFPFASLTTTFLTLKPSAGTALTVTLSPAAAFVGSAVAVPFSPAVTLTSYLFTMIGELGLEEEPPLLA